MLNMNLYGIPLTIAFNSRGSHAMFGQEYAGNGIKINAYAREKHALRVDFAKFKRKMVKRSVKYTTVAPKNLLKLLQTM